MEDGGRLITHKARYHYAECHPYDAASGRSVKDLPVAATAEIGNMWIYTMAWQRSG